MVFAICESSGISVNRTTGFTAGCRATPDNNRHDCVRAKATMKPIKNIHPIRTFIFIFVRSIYPILQQDSKNQPPSERKRHTKIIKINNIEKCDIQNFIFIRRFSSFCACSVFNSGNRSITKFDTFSSALGLCNAVRQRSLVSNLSGTS